jgi:type VI secretion system protein ImpJ
MGLTRKILELCVAKSRALSERRKQQPAGQLDYSTADVIVLGLLQVINATIPTLTHQFTVSRCHPEALFLTLSTLASELMTFSAEADLRPADLPTYNHSNLWDSFSILEVKISQLLEAVISANFLSIRLDKRGDTRWSGKITDEGLLRTAQFYLMTSGDVPERKVVDEMPMKIKIAGPEDIDTLVAAALQGLSLTFVPRPPSGLPVRPGLQYFRLEKTGPLWESVRKSCAVGIFLPGEFRGLKVELVAVKET